MQRNQLLLMIVKTKLLLKLTVLMLKVIMMSLMMTVMRKLAQRMTLKKTMQKKTPRKKMKLTMNPRRKTTQRLSENTLQNLILQQQSQIFFQKSLVTTKTQELLWDDNIETQKQPTAYKCPRVFNDVFIILFIINIKKKYI